MITFAVVATVVPVAGAGTPVREARISGTFKVVYSPTSAQGSRDVRRWQIRATCIYGPCCFPCGFNAVAREGRYHEARLHI